MFIIHIIDFLLIRNNPEKVIKPLNINISKPISKFC